ncbi:MAG: deoxyribonuclease IV [Candidatus Coatesbacteria bacterium]|nr:MAG: deoxyribonuclease IV [Candidatus Coatesbacteria bacterium]
MARNDESKFLLGVHTSIAGGLPRAVERAVALGCSTFQIFPSTPRGWRQKRPREEACEAFRRAVAEHGLEPFFVHLPYLPNLASPADDLYEKSGAALIQALETTARLGGRYVVAHLGSHRGAGAAAGGERVAAALRRAVEATPRLGVTILLENAAGTNAVGTTFTELASLYKMAGAKARRRLGLCLDTCHAHVSGYDLSAGGDGLERLLAEIDGGFGLARLELVHLNDAKAAVGSGRDRHEHIGRGTIGREGFRLIINHSQLRPLPMILETPKVGDWDRKNLRIVKKLRKQQNTRR